jgi:hypothetical protein
MTTAGNNITKASIIEGMAGLYIAYNRNIVWHSVNQPFQTDITGGNQGGYAHAAEGDISDTNVTASTITTLFRDYASLLSRIRSVRLLKWYQIQGDPRASLSSDETNITNLNNDYRADMTGGPVSGNVVDASDLDDFLGALSTAINNNRTSTVTIEEFYCHSNCHGSCHGSL